MVRVITVEREYGSQGAEFSLRLAHRLGWKAIDRCLIEEIAQKSGVAPSRVERCDERLDPWYYRMGRSFWYGSAEHLPPLPGYQAFDSEKMAKLVREYLVEAAEGGHCVILGRGSAFALAATPGVFHVFVYASMKRKIKWFEERFPGRTSAARKEIEAIDERREGYIRRYYGQDWTDRRHYHMMINSCMGCESMIEATLEGAGLAASYKGQAASS